MLCLRSSEATRVNSRYRFTLNSTLTNVSSVQIVDFSTTSSTKTNFHECKLYFSEYWNSKEVPLFYCCVPSGDYNEPHLVQTINVALLCSKCVNYENVKPKNTYSVNINAFTKKLTVRTNNVCNFTVHNFSGTVYASVTSSDHDTALLSTPDNPDVLPGHVVSIKNSLWQVVLVGSNTLTVQKADFKNTTLSVGEIVSLVPHRTSKATQLGFNPKDKAQYTQYAVVGSTPWCFLPPNTKNKSQSYLYQSKHTFVVTTSCSNELQAGDNVYVSDNFGFKLLSTVDTVLTHAQALLSVNVQELFAESVELCFTQSDSDLVVVTCTNVRTDVTNLLINVHTVYEQYHQHLLRNECCVVRTSTGCVLPGHVSDNLLRVDLSYMVSRLTLLEAPYCTSDFAVELPSTRTLNIRVWMGHKETSGLTLCKVNESPSVFGEVRVSNDNVLSLLFGKHVFQPVLSRVQFVEVEILDVLSRCSFVNEWTALLMVQQVERPRTEF